LAKDGWTHTRILRHFYSGTKVERTDAPPAIRVALTSGEKLIHLTAKSGPVQLLVGDPENGKLAGQIPPGETWTVRPSGGGYRVADASGAPVGGHAWGGPSEHLFARYAGRVAVPEGGAAYNRGRLELNLHACGAQSCRLRLVLEVPFEGYLLGIGEVPSSWPREALEAQAVAARSFALHKIRRDGLQASCNCHVTDGANDQVYIGWNKEGGPQGERWVRAVRATARRVVTYGGDVALTVFSASDGGHTEDIDVQWGTPLSAYPYLAGVCDPGEYTQANPWTDWTRTFSTRALTDALRARTGDIGTVTGFERIIRGVSGRIDDMVVTGTTGEASLGGGQLRSALGLPDDRVWINANRNVVGEIRATYDATMCAPGIPTSIARPLPGGSRQTFEVGAIYRNGSADVTVWLNGAIYSEYLQVGAAKGKLGLPTSGVLPIGGRSSRLACGAGCSRVEFSGGRIYRGSGRAAHALWGRVLATYLANGGAVGRLGLPTSRVQQAPSGSSEARFEHGKITCGPGGTCRVRS
jgi:SpoIID/LytB domain protein